MTPGEVDLDALLAPERWDTRRCTVPQALAEIPDEKTRARVAAACEGVRVKPKGVVLAFRGLIGDGPGDQTIRRHRLRNCGCP